MNTIFWLCAMVLFVVIEAVTTSLVSIWFALGALAATVCAYCGVGQTVQIIVFAIVSAIALTVFKKFFNKKITPTHQPTNADRLVGAEAVVTEDIDPLMGTGAVKAYSQLWSAKADYPIKKGSVVTVVEIKGVKLVVKEKAEV